MQHYFDARKEQILERLNALFPEQKETYQCDLFSAARYSILSGGKRVRPLLVLAAGEAFGAPVHQLLDPACALEIVHTYSLIHDDLPCMDDDDERRDKPTLHKIYNEGHATLTGDFLLTFAFELLAKAPLISSDVKIELVRILASSAGADGMVGGQAVDLSLQEQEIDLPLLEFLHLKKTALLIRAALEFGGTISGASPRDLKLLALAGEHLGLAFQVIDDILDAGTAVQLLGETEARSWAEDLSEKATRALSSLSVPAPALLFLTDQLLLRTT